MKHFFTNIFEFQRNFCEHNFRRYIGHEGFQSALKSFYGEEPRYFRASMEENSLHLMNDRQNSGFDKAVSQVNNLRAHMGSLGLTSFAELANKFHEIYNTSLNAIVFSRIKETMEGIYYYVVHREESKEGVIAQFKDKVFICGEGVLANLQSILAEIALRDYSVDEYIAKHKKQLITQVALDMYRRREFDDFVNTDLDIDDEDNVIGEIHNITSILNSVAQEFGLLKKRRNEDRWMIDILPHSKEKLLVALNKTLLNLSMMNTFIEVLACDIARDLPYFSSDKYENMNQFNMEVGEVLARLKMPLLKVETIVKMKEYEPQGYKENINSIIRESLVLYFSNKGVFHYLPVLESVNKINVETQVDDSGNTAVTDIMENTAIDSASTGRFIAIFKYAIDTGLKFDAAIFGTDDPLEYAVKRGIKMFNEDVKIYYLKETALEYCKMNTQEMRLFLEEKYKRIVLHNKILPESKTQDIAVREDLDLQSPTSSKAADDTKDDSKLITLVLN